MPIILKKLRCIQRRKPNGDGARRLPHSIDGSAGSPHFGRSIAAERRRILLDPVESGPTCSAPVISLLPP
jgi:hypothetical protein